MARRIAGWTAVVSGILFLSLFVASAFAWGRPAVSPTGSGWMMGGHGFSMPFAMPFPMGPGHMAAHHGWATAGGSPSTAIPGAPEVRVEARNFAFAPSEVRVPHQQVNLTLVNPQANGVLHDFTVPDLGIRVVASPGETTTLGLRDLRPGRYAALCSVPGHADLGMRATLVVE